MKKIEIKRWDTAEVIVCGEYESIRDCVEKNKNKSFYRADMSEADMRGADMSGADMSEADMRGADMCWANMSGANMSEADMRGADMCWANMSGANMSEADMSEADMCWADMSGIKNYSENRNIFIHLIKNNLIKFSVHQQEIASRIFTLELCWESIKKEYGKEIVGIFKILKDLGWDEYAKEWAEIK